jgi:hypothetical protein
MVSRRLVFARGSLKVEEPRGAGLVEGLLPGFVVGLGDAGDGDGGPFLALGRIDGKQPITAPGGLYRRARSGATSGPADLALELVRIGALTVHGAVITIGDGAGPEDRRLEVDGDLETAQIIGLLVGAGGFDEEGARNLIAGILGFTPEGLPERVAFRLSASGTEE